MRTFQNLDQAEVNTATGVITLSKQGDGDGSHPTIAMRREGAYVVISASYGPFEIALRMRHAELARTISHLQPNDGLNTTRQVGTGEAYLALGKHNDGALILRPTIVGDATGYFCLNLMLSPQPAAILSDWIGTETLDNPEGHRM